MGLAQPPEYTFLPSGIPTKGEALLMCFFHLSKETHQQKQPLDVGWIEVFKAHLAKISASTPPKKYYTAYKVAIDF